MSVGIVEENWVLFKFICLNLFLNVNLALFLKILKKKCSKRKKIL